MTVIKVNNATVRNIIEDFTSIYTFPDVIKFVQDGNGEWVTSPENLLAIQREDIKKDLRDYFNSRGIPSDVNTIKDALQIWGESIDYVTPKGLDI